MPSAYEGTDIIMSAANNKVPGYPLEIFDFVSGSGSYIIFALQIYHTATPYIISRKRYIIYVRVQIHTQKCRKYLFSSHKRVSAIGIPDGVFVVIFCNSF